MYSLVIAEIFIYKNPTISDTKAYENIYITFNPYSGTDFRSHASLSDAQQYVDNENKNESKRSEAQKSDVITDTLKLKYDNSIEDTVSIDKDTSLFLEKYNKTHNTHPLSKTLFTVTEKHIMNDELDSTNVLVKRNIP
ncbi:hypothetical protein [Escherichia coli]|uniref:hypothetical protein n=1 Tax=Escherichia coli TaxID=562 RepID=UPI0012BA8029|nr:hypothetical protein [Escherichia coli]MTE29340.1 hypothetical protein [Escherichia coli]